MRLKNNKYYTEVYGMGGALLRHDPGMDGPNHKEWYDRSVDAIQRSGPRDDSTRFELDTHSMADWQIKMTNLMRTKNDCFASVPPAAGKTVPIKAAWANLFLNALRSGVDRRSPEFPRVIYVAKTKQLAMEGMLQNFQMWIYQLLLTTKIDGVAFNNGELLSLLGIRGVKEDSPLNETLQKNIHQLVQSLSAIRMGGIDPGVIKSDIYTFKPIIITTPIMTSAGGPDYKAVADLVRNYSKYFCMIIVDEFQQYIPMPGRDLDYGKFTRDSNKNFDMIFNIIKYAQPHGKCGVHLLTGTVNKDTANQFCELMNSDLHRNFQLIAGEKSDPLTDRGDKNFAGNRAKLTVVPMEKMGNAEETLDVCTDIVRTKQTRSIMVIFSTRRTASTGIFNLLTKLIKKLPARDPDSLLDGKISKNVVAKDLYKILDKDYINPEFNPDMNPIGMVKPGDGVEVNDIEYLKLFDVDKAEQQGEDADDNPLPLLNKPNENNLLYLGVLRGVGVMVGKMDNRMKGIIQKLFRREKIFLLLATDKITVRLKLCEFGGSPTIKLRTIPSQDLNIFR